MGDGVAQDRKQSLVLGVVVGALSEVLAEFGELVALGVLNDDAVSGRPWISAGAAVDVSGAGGGC